MDRFNYCSLLGEEQTQEYKPYVQKRLEKIRNVILDNDEWMLVPSKMNSADLLLPNSEAGIGSCGTNLCVGSNLGICLMAIGNSVKVMNYDEDNMFDK